jgi:hypothetical protein
VEAGIEKGSIWEDVKAQSVLGVEGFAEALVDHVTGKSEIREIPKGQRFLRPALDRLFDGVRDRKRSRDGVIAAAVKRYGYSQMEVANYLHLHYSTISRLIKMMREISKVKILQDLVPKSCSMCGVVGVRYVGFIALIGKEPGPPH